MNFIENFFIRLRLFFLFRKFASVFLDFDSVFLGGMAKRFGISKIFNFHEERNGRTTLPARKILPDLFAWRNDKARRFFIMKWTQAFKIGACSFQLHIFANDFFHPNRGKYFINSRFRNHSVKIGNKFLFFQFIWA